MALLSIPSSCTLRWCVESTFSTIHLYRLHALWLSTDGAKAVGWKEIWLIHIAFLISKCTNEHFYVISACGLRFQYGAISVVGSSRGEWQTLSVELNQNDSSLDRNYLYVIHLCFFQELRKLGQKWVYLSQMLLMCITICCDFLESQLDQKKPTKHNTPNMHVHSCVFYST